MHLFVDQFGRTRDGDVAAIARELAIMRPDFDVAAWVVKALGWVEFVLMGNRRMRWRPSQLRGETARTARRLLLEAGPLTPIELVRWTDAWRSATADGLEAAWALGEAIGSDAAIRPLRWRIIRRRPADLYRDRNRTLIEDLSRVAARTVDRAVAAEVVASASTGLLSTVECRRRGEPFHYLGVGRRERLFDRPEAFTGHDLRESSDPAFSAFCVPSYEAAMTTDEPVVEDIEGPIQFADGRTRDVAYRRVLVRVAGSGDGPAIIMRTSVPLRPFVPIDG
jgi:hypothetical protein